MFSIYFDKVRTVNWSPYVYFLCNNTLVVLFTVQFIKSPASPASTAQGNVDVIIIGDRL